MLHSSSTINTLFPHMENAETQTWLEFAVACKYINQQEQEALLNLSEQVGNLLNHMIRNAEKYK